ncbi:MAG: T9SS type A sorting domain-containing protein, partial [Calditrichia bacterium]|nr:T9SS type A sorting domain-containing protein [Calditrichia bacterium]
PERIRISVYPNPFNNRCRFQFQLLEASNVKLVIYDILGRIIRVVAHGRFPGGLHYFDWDGRNENNLELGSGMYIYQFVAGEQKISDKVLLLK